MADKVSPDHLAAMERIHSVTGCRTPQELGDYLGVRQSSIYDAKRRRTIPADWLLKLLRYSWVNPEWILTGHGARMLQPVDDAETVSPPPLYIKEMRPVAECTVEELVREVVRRAMVEMR